MSGKKHQIATLLFEENEDHATLVREALTASTEPNFDVTWAASRHEAQEYLDAERFDLVITDMFYKGKTLAPTLPEFINAAQGAPVVVISGAGDEAYAAAAMKAGCADYLVKNRKTLDDLPKRCAAMLKPASRHKDGRTKRPRAAGSGDLLGNLFQEIERIAQLAEPILGAAKDRAQKEISGLLDEAQRIRRKLGSSDPKDS